MLEARKTTKTTQKLGGGEKILEKKNHIYFFHLTNLGLTVGLC